MIQQYILGLDIGTSSVRAALYTINGEMLPETLVKNERNLDATADGGAEIDADEAFEQVVAAVDEVLKKTKKIKGEIGYVASCAFWHSLVGVDAKGKPTTKVFGWADTRSGKHIAKLRSRFDESAVHNRTGARFHSSFWPAKLLWLRETYPKVWRKTERWLSFSDLVSLRLFGECETSISMASGTGIFDIRKCEWNDELAKYVRLKSDNLPRINESDSASFTLTAKFARRWQRLKDARWFPVIADGAANNIGSGCVSKDHAALMIGTSGAIRVAYKGGPPDKIPAGLWCYRIDRKRVIIGGALSDGGGLYAWLKDNLRIDGSDVEIGVEMARRGADAHGLTLMPFFAGERSTGYHKNAAGAIIGLQMSHDPIDILQAAMESVAYRFAEILDQLKGVSRIRDIVASGGALRQSPVWTQIIADVLGRDLTLPDSDEASMRGAVLLALETIGRIDDIADFAPPTNKLEFHPKCQAIYKKARKRHNLIYDQIFNLTE